MNTRFRPWIGPNYPTPGSGGIRILILGESHYGDKSWGEEELTEKVVRKWAIENRSAFFTKIAKAVLNVPPESWLGNQMRAGFWNSVAFYNYIQTHVGPGPRVRPTNEMWIAAQTPFLGLLEDLMPNAVIVFGKQLWHHLPLETKRVEADGQTLKLFRISRGFAAAAMVQHPSSGGFRYVEWQPKMQTLLRYVQTSSSDTSV